MIKFSIVTSCFNSEEYITETIESVVKQTEFINGECELEYIIIDGNSTDNTNSIIESYKKKYPSITHIIEKDKGLYDGLTKGFQRVSGDVMGYLNAGDFFNKTAFSVLKNVFLNQNVNWVTGFKIIYNQQSEITKIQFPYKYRSHLIRSGVYGKYLPFIQQESTFWRPNLLETVDLNYFKTLKKSGDMYLWYCFSKKYKLNIVNSYLSGFKYHDNQLTFRETGSTDLYLQEAKNFIDKKKIKDYLWIFFDALPWYLGRNLNSIFSWLNSDHIDYFRYNKSWKEIDIVTKKNKLICWVCDFNPTNGEGIIANMFLDQLVKKKKFLKHDIFIRNLSEGILFSNLKNEKYAKTEKLTFAEKYISPFVGLIYLWYNFLLGRKVCFVNFLPLWNFLLFLCLPPNTILGPITGSKHYDIKSVKGFEKFFRSYLMPIQFTISNFILKFRFKNLLFSTRNLEDQLSDVVRNKSEFDFMLNLYNINEINVNKDKKVDFIFYIRFYPSKGTQILVEYINKLKTKYSIVTVGDKTGIDGIKEYGLITRDEVLKLCNDSKFSIVSSENFFSFFSFDCIQNNAKIFFSNAVKYDKRLEEQKKVFPMDIYDMEKSANYIEEVYKENY